LRDTIEVSDSVFSKHATRLEDAGYVKIRKGYAGKRPRTWPLLDKLPLTWDSIKVKGHVVG
jgi:DNA-binding MarR family transcriptional regulator